MAAGKFLQIRGQEETFHLHGICYGPFAPNSRGLAFPEHERLISDLKHVAALGFNTVRLYELPDETVLKAASEQHLRLICGIPWTDHIDFLDQSADFQRARDQIASAAATLSQHPTVAAILIGNEIEKTLVRWMGPERVRDAIESLIDAARAAAPQTLISYATYPSTEYLVPRNADFLAVNVYLERRADFSRYLARLQNLAGNKPLLITEFGIDVATHSDDVQAETLKWWHDELLASGSAGGIWFSYTDEWHRGGQEVTAWHFGIVDRQRHSRPACDAAAALTLKLAPPPQPPRISVIVCTRNGASTLRSCLHSLQALNYPDYEVLVIDDGSTDTTSEIVKGFSSVRYHLQSHAGLSVARNCGAQLATGAIIAYTDDDCIAHADWLLHLSHAFTDPAVTAAGGPNIPPPPRNRIERIVAAAPGAPAHVLLSDTEAEHLPGCNLAIRKDALLSIDGFRSMFTSAGDDVDICWRLREAGGSMRFVPGAMVWHHRRFSICGYLKQQRGYGRAEALLMSQHPQRFGPLGGARWRGGIYGDHLPADHPVEGSIFHGALGLGAFQTIYSTHSDFRWWDWLTGVLWVSLAAVALALQQPWIAASITLFALWASWRICTRNAHALCIRGVGNRLLLWLLCFLQPVVREFARLRGMLQFKSRPSWRPTLPDIIPPIKPRKISLSLGALTFWNDQGHDRHHWLQALRFELNREHQITREDDGWRWFDIETMPHLDLSRAFLSVTEYHGQDRCLTRVRHILRIRRSILWNLILFASLDIGMVFIPIQSIHFLGIILATALILALFATPLFIRRDMHRLTRSAAAKAMLSEITSAPVSPPAATALQA